MDSVIRVKNLTKIFSPPGNMIKICPGSKNSASYALRNISFSISEGEILGIIGLNGAGKTTLLKILAASILPDKGSVHVADNKTVKKSIQKKGQIGYLWSDNRNFYWRLSGRQNLEFFASLYEIRDKNIINNLLDYFSVEKPDSRFDSLSDGTKQKISAIRAFFHFPEIILLDEPMKNLDLKTCLKLQKLIRDRMSSGLAKAVLFAGHNINELQQLCSSFLILHRGEILIKGTLKEIRDQTGRKNANLQEIFTELTEKDGF